MTTMNEERARAVDAMCMTWRHDFGLDRKDDELGSCGMTDAERDALRRQMGQLYDHHFAAWQRAQGAVPDGYALVPVEPTREMVEAALRSEDASFDSRSIVITDYRAMLAAAPAHPAERQEQEEVQRLREAEELLWLAHKSFGDQKAIRSGERGASDRQQAQNRIFKWLNARRTERVAALAASTGQEVEK